MALRHRGREGVSSSQLLRFVYERCKPKRENENILPVRNGIQKEECPHEVLPHMDIGGEFKKWGKIPLKQGIFPFRWGISTTFRA